MPTDTPPTPPPCDTDVFASGVPIFVTNTIRSFNIEPWVQKIAATSGQRVDWHFSGGRAIVLCLGDVQKARAALREHRAEHDALFRAASTMSPEEIDRYLASMWVYASEEMAETGLDERAKYMVPS